MDDPVLTNKRSFVLYQVFEDTDGEEYAVAVSGPITDEKKALEFRDHYNKFYLPVGRTFPVKGRTIGRWRVIE